MRAGDLGRSLMSGDRGLSAYVSWGGAPEDGVEVNVGACESNYDEGVRFGQLMMRENFELPSADSPLEAPFGWIEKNKSMAKEKNCLI